MQTESGKKVAIKKKKVVKVVKPFSDPRKMTWPTRYRIELTKDRAIEGLFLGFFRGNPQISVRPAKGGTVDLDVKSIVKVYPVRKADCKPHGIRKVVK